MNNAINLSQNLQEQDAILLSYPRSGNTWTRLVLAVSVILTIDPPLLKKMGVYQACMKLIPDHYRTGFYRDLQSQLRVRPVFKTHDWVERIPNKIVYLFRRPEDVLVSYFDYARKGNYVSDEITIDTFAVGNLPNWKSHIEKALHKFHISPDSFLPISYEYLIEQPIRGFEIILEWLGLPFSEVSLKKSLRINSVERTRRRFFVISKYKDRYTMLQGRPGLGKSMLSDHTLNLIREVGDPLYEQLRSLTKNI